MDLSHWPIEAKREALALLERKAELLTEREREAERRRLAENRETIRNRCKTLDGFVREAWHVLEPSNPFIHGWHVDAICEHLEAITLGDINRLLINVPPGTMKALDEDTPVLTTWGWKRHGDLISGDFVFGPDGQPKRVTACTPEVVEEAFAVEFDDGTEIVAGGAHEWVVERDFVDAASRWRRARRALTVETRDLVHGSRPDRIRIAAPPSLPPRDLLIDPYMLGAWLGDGGTNSGCLHVGEEDVEHFAQWAEVGTVYPPTGARKRTFYRMRVEGLQVRLRVLGLLGNKRIPEPYMTASVEQRWALLQGLMDTDGTADKAGSCSFTNANGALAEQVARLVESLGMKAHRRSRYTTLNGQRFGPHHRVTFSPAAGDQPFRLERKQTRVRPDRSERASCRYVKAVHPVGSRVTKCIEVEGGVYLAGHALCPTHNSLLSGVFWPAWEWGPIGRPATRIIGSSYSEDYAKRDNRRMRDLVTSDWYRSLWPVELVRAGEMAFSNTATGFRQGVPFSRLTGGRGDRVIIDDPHSVDGAESEAERSATVRTFRESVPTRLNNPEKSAILVIMQRLHEQDVSGTILSLKLGYEHLMLPMEFEPERKCFTSIGFEDPRKTDGELLFPERFPREVVERDKVPMGSYAVAGQFQQRPAPRSGGMFQRGDFEIVDAIPAKVKRRVRAWDFAASKPKPGRQPDWTVGLRMALADGVFYVEVVDRGRWSASEVERMLRNIASQDGTEVTIRQPQDPGAAGKADSETKTRLLAGYSVVTKTVSGDKATRARPAAAQAEAGNVKLLRGEWNEAFLDEVCSFPNAQFDDQIDAFADALNELALGKSYTYDLGTLG